MDQTFECVNLEPVALKMASSLHLQDVLTTITQGLIDELGAAFARIWLIGPGDLCDECYKASDCTSRNRCLHLKASAGIYTNLNGEYRRVPLGAFLIGSIAAGEGPFFTNDLLSEEKVPDKKWIRKNGFRSYAGYPLLFREDILGVLAMFSCSTMPQQAFDHMAGFASQAAVAITNAQLFAEVEQLKDRLRAENVYLREEIKLSRNFEEIIGESKNFLKVLQKAEKVSATSATVLILGETGTGKELLARAIHNISDRKDRPLVKVNCAALPQNLIESELFGHERGAFTGAVSRKLGRFELADRGTIFLDEIGELPLEVQSKLLQVLQDGEFTRVGSTKPIKVNVRVLAATNQDLESAVRKGEFRNDLYFRLNVFPITMPPLRERKKDIPLLVRHFIKKYNPELGKKIKTVPKKAMKAFQVYDWPGNLRELENVIERAIILSPQNKLFVDEIFDLSAGELPTQNYRKLEDVERVHILKVLEDCGWIVEGDGGAALVLGLKPATLRFRMKKLGIQRPK